MSIETEITRLSTLSPIKLQSGSKERREYGVSFISAGRVRSRDGTEANWEIPAETLKAAIDKFNSLAVFVDHADSGFFSDGYPEMKHLAGVTFGAKWNDELQSIDGGIRMYNTAIGLDMTALLDDVLSDQKAGLEVPDIGLSLVFFGRHDYIDIGEEPQEKFLRVTKEITKTESEDIVFGPGTKNARVREILSTLSKEVNLPKENKMNKCDTCGAEIKEGENHQCATNSGKLAFAESKVKPGDTVQEALFPHKPKGWQLIGPDGQTLEVPQEQLATIPAAQSLPEVQFTLLNSRLDAMQEKFASMLDAGVVIGNGKPVQDKKQPFGDRMTTQTEQVVNAYEKMMGLNVNGPVHNFMGLKDLYFSLTGDWNLTGQYNADNARIKVDPQDLYGYLATQKDVNGGPYKLAYNPAGNNADTTTMAELTRNVMNKIMIDQYDFVSGRSDVDYMFWEKVCKLEDFNSLQTISWVRLAGISDLPSVAEKAEYTQLAWDDARTTADFTKYGGYLPLSLEMIDKDDLAGWRAAPRKLINAAIVTIGSYVSAQFTDNSGIGPSITTEGSTANLFSSTWGNLITQALSADGWLGDSGAVQTMYKLAEFGVSGRRIGLRPRFLMIPIELESQAYKAVTQSNEPGSFNDLRPRQSLIPVENVITVPYWTNADNWAALADPMLVPLLGIGFRFGRMPELFTEATNTGLMFFNDVMPIKVRWFFAIGAIDPRGGIKSNL